MPEPSPTARITFQPQGQTVQVPRGTLLLDAAAQVGLLIDLPCGGQGRCGRCKVKVHRGELTHRENPHLTPQQLADGWVLACTARAAGDLVLEVPPREERERVETAAQRRAAPPALDWPRYPAVRQVVLKLKPPSLEDNAADLSRFRLALAQELGIENVAISLPQMRTLPGALRAEGWEVTATVEMAPSGLEARLVDLKSGAARGSLLGAAVDIGTTNVVVYLVDLRSGRLIEWASMPNKQAACGEDVISRILYSLRPNGLERLHRLAIEAINELLGELTRANQARSEDIYDMVVAANTTMAHLFLGIPPRHIREEPYIPATNFYPVARAGDLGVAINPNASITCIPSVAAYVGGDITAGVLSSGLFKTDKLTLFLDVGTNGEIVMGNADWMMTDACSAGPAFEGAGVRHGLRATKGAIDDVVISARTLEPTLRVMGEVPPRGICGSGMLSALADMLITGVVNKAGRINLPMVRERMGERSRARMGDHGAEYVLAWAPETGIGEDIVLTEVDISNIIRAKAAIYAGIAVMLRKANIQASDIQEVLIGGALGQHVNIEQAIQIGLLPDLPWERFKYLGNTSVRGAFNALLSLHARAKAEEIAGQMTYLELIADNTFMEEFTAALFLPHTNLDNFPSVKPLLVGGEQ
ncbi:MAG: ASKHA domain-containing protein [Chloroflexota bacterium]|nr:ASKHA domain-containing protein [Chloroflexota bacterium]